MKGPDVSIIGTGALGSVLTKAVHAQNIKVKSIFNRSLPSCKSLADELEIGIFGTFPDNIGELGELVFLTVSDDDIPGVTNKLSELPGNWDDRCVVHCSGNASSSVLDQLKQRGAMTAAFHPLQTFTGLSDPSDLNGIYFNMEGDTRLLAILGELADRLGASAFEITPESKSYLHAAAVMASNYLVALLHASENIGGMGGMDAQIVKRALVPLVLQSVENVKSGKLSDVLSGPIARGDSSTVRQHLELLKPDGELFTLYKQLGRQALELAKQKGTLSKEQITELEYLLAP